MKRKKGEQEEKEGGREFEEEEGNSRWFGKKQERESRDLVLLGEGRRKHHSGVIRIERREGKRGLVTRLWGGTGDKGGLGAGCAPPNVREDVPNCCGLGS